MLGHHHILANFPSPEDSFLQVDGTVENLLGCVEVKELRHSEELRPQVRLQLGVGEDQEVAGTGVLQPVQVEIPPDLQFVGHEGVEARQVLGVARVAAPLPVVLRQQTGQRVSQYQQRR